MIHSNLRDIGEIYSGILQEYQHKVEMLKVDNKHKDELLEERSKMILKMGEYQNKIEGDKEKLEGRNDELMELLLKFKNE